ncbi:MAG: hypothetical protein V7K38_05325 [Nostoc sp.]|uniref:hypothetical protein n=1 Tax=Nostoc sp. TaxID=1180 RepID=UPI002FF63553
MISAIVLENKRSNARSIYSSKFGFDFYFPRVTKQGYVECFYSTRLTTSVARDTRSGKFCPIPSTTSWLSRCVANSIETATRKH